jgi:hypothetical protein
MPVNYVLLEKIVVGAAGASSVTFNSIPQTGYTDLAIKCSVRGLVSALNVPLGVRFNGDSGANYRNLAIQGSGASAISYSQTGQTSFNIGNGTGATATANTFGSTDVYIPNYTSSNQKSISADDAMENNATTAYNTLTASLWSGTAAITSISIADYSGSTSFGQYSTFYLYGVAKLGTTPAIAPKATGGDTIMTDGTYWYHAFKSSGTFTPAQGLSCDVLVVAGGGGGGGSSNTGYYAAGGGAGGVLAFASQSLSTAQTVTIGAGGAGGLSPSGTRGSNGTNTTFASLTAAVGGGGGGGGGDAYPTQLSGAAGGSGGGGNSTSGTGGSPTSGQGNAGGTGGGTYQVTPQSGGGGGGAGGAGGAGGSGGVGGGAGGAGTNSVTNWGALSAALTATGLGVSGFIAGGAGGNSNSAGGAAGSGGGGIGAAAGGAGGVGVANTGSGAGATSAGGSGLVLVRYAV